MTPPRQSKLDKILEDLIEQCHGNIWWDYKTKEKNPAINEAKIALLDSFLELIGEDGAIQTISVNDDYIVLTRKSAVIAQNELRNQLRQAAEKQWGVLSAKLIATCSYCGQEFNSHQEIQQHIANCSAAPKEKKG